MNTPTIAAASSRAQRNSLRALPSALGVSSAPDPVLNSLLDEGTALAVSLVASQKRWCVGSGFSPGYVCSWMQDGGPFGVCTRTLYQVARMWGAAADAITAHFQAVVEQAKQRGLTNEQVHDRFWAITEELEPEATLVEDRAATKLRRTRDLDGLEAADLAKAGLHIERAALKREAARRRVDLFVGHLA
jgi:hypothetical protein